MKGGIPKDNGLVHVAADLDDDTGTDVWVLSRCRAEDSIRHNETGEMTHALRIQTVEAAVVGDEFAARMAKLHDDMREKRTGSRQMQLGEADEGIPGGSTGDESEAERQSRLARLEQEALEREALEDANLTGLPGAAESAADSPASDPATEQTSEAQNSSERPPAPPATFSADNAAGQDDATPDPAAVPDEIANRRAARPARRRSGKAAR